MGIGVSKNSPLVNLCKQRKDLIKAAMNCRYELALAHVLYFQSMLDVGNALNRFVEEALEIVVESPVDQVELSHLVFSSSESESDVDSLTDYVHRNSVASEDSDSSSPCNRSKLKEHLNAHSSTATPSTLPENDLSYSQDEDKVSIGVIVGNSPTDFSNCHKENSVSYGKPVIFPDNDARFAHNGNRVPSDCDPMDRLHGDFRFYDYQNEVSSGVLMDMQSHNLFYNPRAASPPPPFSPPREVQDWDFFNLFGRTDEFAFNYYAQDGYESEFSSSIKNHILREVRYREGIPSLEDEIEQNTDDKVIKEMQFKGDIKRASVDSTLKDKEMKLEGDIKIAVADSTLKNKEMKSDGDIKSASADSTSKGKEMKSDRDIKCASADSTSKGKDMKLDGDIKSASADSTLTGVPSKSDEDEHFAQETENENSEHAAEAQEKEISRDADIAEQDIKESSETFASRSLKEEEATPNKGADTELHPLSVEGEPLEITLTQSATCGQRDLQEVVKDIRDAFETAYTFGREVSVLLEAGKVPYQPMGTKVKEYASRICVLIAPSMVASPQHSTDLLSRWSASKMVAMAKANIGNVDEKDCRKFGDLSSTLMGLYEWEKKLYKEVVDEEKLRVLYDKDCKKLRDMTDRGVDFRDISMAHSSIKRLLSRINVAVTAVDVVSTRIHKLRDEELHSQLNELIEGLVRMWKLVLECHEKQSKSIKETESCVHIKIDGIKKNSSLKEIFRLKMEISNWGRHFSNYVKLQKRFAELLNEWLSKCLSEEQEESPNVSVPLSPGKMGAPPIFIVCKDWHHAIEKISETGVSKAIHDFSSSLHQLWEKQDEERNQRLKVKHISKDIEAHIRAQGRENLISWNKDAALEIVTTLEDPTLLQDELDGNMVSMMKKLVEQRAKHDEAVQLVNNVASSCLKESLVPIFEALESFCLENLKAYEKIRIPEGSMHT